MVNQKTFLVVDDIPLMRLMLKKHITLMGKTLVDADGEAMTFTILESDNGQTAYDTLQENEVDLIFLDMMMPKVDGLGFLNMKKDAPRNADVPVVITSAVTDQALIDKANTMGVQAYINKPFTKEMIEKEIKAAFNVTNVSPA